MCGLAGVVDWRRQTLPDLTAAIQVLACRGPDAQGELVESGIALAHTRLAVLDLSPSASQPMTTSDGRFLMVFNGEIYNFRQLREELVTDGVRFRSSGDSEVVLEGFRVWGAEIFRKLDGMFAVALWDSETRKLTLARDRFGEKPLFYTRDSFGKATFASTLNALLAIDGVSRSIDPAGALGYLQAGYMPSPGTIVTGVSRVQPGEYLELDQSHIERHAYWSLASTYVEAGDHQPPWSTVEQAIGDFRDRLAESVRSRVIADVPVGIMLSGGVDSGLIASALRDRSDSIIAFTAAFDDEEYAEQDQAAATASAMGLKHVVGRIPELHPDDFIHILDAAQEPFADSSMFAYWQLAQLAREHVTVALGGDGADEFFAGYPTHVAGLIRRRLGPLRRPTGQMLGTLTRFGPAMRWGVRGVSLDFRLRAFSHGVALSDEESLGAWRTIMRPQVLQEISSGRLQVHASSWSPPYEWARSATRGVPGLDRDLCFEALTWMPDDILTKVDRMSMAHGLEVRSPFLSPQLVEFAASLPAQWKLRGTRGKWILRRAAKDALPMAIANAPKRGFRVPMARWLGTSLKDVARELTLTGPTTDLVDPTAVAAMWDRHLSGQSDESYALFALTSLGRWLDIQRAQIS